MNLWKKVLCPVDFSVCSRQALTLATELAKRFEAELILLHVHELPGIPLPTGEPLLSSRMAAQAELQAEQGLSETKQEAIDLGAERITTATRVGSAATELTRFAEEKRCDLIVMGTHGRTGFKHALLGSVAEQVVRSAICPVLTVRQSSSLREGSP